MRQGVAILGSTGTIGVNTLDVIERNPQRYRVVALSAHRNVSRLLAQCRQWQPAYAVLADATQAEHFSRQLLEAGLETRVLSGVEGLCEIARLGEVDQVMAGIVGAAGLLPTLAAAQAGKRVLLANKEALVMSGALFMRAVREHGAQLLPIDSEHNAIFQCLPEGGAQSLSDAGIESILLTASGGPFREYAPEQLERVTPEQACAHPNWVMGRKISVDSATMMNKGLEIIEACWLFNTTPQAIQVVIHPQSVIHSMVAYRDGSVLAELGNPDMRTPIAHAMAWPERVDSGVAPLDLFAIAQLDFEPPDETRFPCLRLAKEAWQQGGAATTVLNAANEIAVARFLTHELAFTAIPNIIETCLTELGTLQGDSVDELLQVDAQTRALARQLR